MKESRANTPNADLPVLHTRKKGRQNFGKPNMVAITINGKDSTDPANYHGPHHHPALALRTTPLSARAHVMPMVGYQPHTHYLPSLKKQLKQICRGEYVDFNVLVAPAGLGLPLTPTTKANPGLRISSLPKWFHAWNQFLLANVVYHPDLVPALLIYQARICQYAEHQDFNSVVCYDAAVRTRIANNPNMHWATSSQTNSIHSSGGRNM